MDNEIKLNLNIKLPGSTMISEQLCSENSDCYDDNKLIITDKRNKKHIINFKTRKTIPATQSINITKQAYDYYISKECPSFCKNKEWLTMSKYNRLNAHLDEICKTLGGLSYTYKVFDD